MSNGFRYSQNQFYFIDSLVPDLWLPDAACTVFEKAFSLKLDNETGLYLVSDSLHQQLLGQNNNVTFTIGPGTDPTTGQSSDKTFEITMPYWAFDLQADFPLTPNKTNYFPLRRASSNSTQYTLGRAFLQAAYVIADYESQNFSVNAAKFPEQGAKENLVQIPGKLTQTQSSGNSKKSSSLSGGAIAGIAIGAVAAIAIIALAAFFIWRKKRRAQHMPAEKDERSSDPPAQTADPYGLRQEMDANPEAVPPALVGGMQRPKAPYSEVDGSESSLHEAPTSGGAMSEMEGSDPKYGPPRGPPRIHHNVFEMDTGQHNAQEMETPVHTPKSTPAGSPISRPGQQLGAGTSASGGAPSPLGPGSATSHSPGGTSPMGRSPRSPAAGPNIR